MWLRHAAVCFSVILVLLVLSLLPLTQFDCAWRLQRCHLAGQCCAAARHSPLGICSQASFLILS